ncbi:Rho GTPase activation protein [Zychaea mexicana]|uniref:Rho GTPase activation protein n=1 Tax=Zychaea mexicana TaxID=64656 RepID=UPI0022FEAF11|nr:Rho GTPase activation protein [Zychaea mexicana]KAI9484488.1 Rho GTPase activation protein [Zychaea mexicana]
MTQTQTEQQQQQQQRKTISKRRSFSAWLRRKVTPKGSVRKVTPREGVGAPFTEPRAVFGVPLVESIQYARQTISYQDEDGTVYRQAGAIPTVVAKCGLFLKSNALQTEGIFRLSGSLKRVAALQETFNKPSYGVSVDWEGLTVHDAATLFRRYLNQLPDPVIIHEYYQPFRDVMNDNSYDSIEERIDAFQILIGKLPLPHQQLLLYLLDMLNLFARHSEDNRMDASNLAAVFCPAVLSHPSHNTPVQYKISQRVIEFLIEFQALFTMQMVVHNSKERSNSVSSDGAFVGKGDDGDNVPPVPVLPDWVGATFIAQRTVPPLDMETVHRGGGTGTVRHDHGISPPLDSGTDVKTPAPFHVKDSDGCSSSDDGDGIPTPRRLPSPPPTAGGITASSLPASPWSVSQEQQPLPGSTTKSLSSSTESTSRDSNVWTVLHEWNSKYCKEKEACSRGCLYGRFISVLAETIQYKKKRYSRRNKCTCILYCIQAIQCHSRR